LKKNKWLPVKGIDKSSGKPLRLLALVLSVFLLSAFDDIRYRPSFNQKSKEAKQEQQESQETENSESYESPEQIRARKSTEDKEGDGEGSKAVSEMEKQQKILEQYKPLIESRTYADLVTVREWAPSLKLNRLPALGETIVPGRSPEIRLIPYLLKSFEHAAYKARYKNVEYFIAVNCEGPSSFDDCSTIPNNQFKGRAVYVRFLQSSDQKFKGVAGMKIGDSFAKVSHLFADDAAIHGNGECLETKEEWLACFDGNAMEVNKKRLQMMPSKNAKLLRFLKVQGRGY